MTSLTISDIEPTLAERLRRRAIQHGLSVEAEAHRILQHALDGEDIVIAPRETTREPPRFE